MAKDRQKPPFWRRGKPDPKYDIELLRPAALARGKRFETLADAQQESERSEQLLRSFSGGNKELADFLAECRAGDYECNRPFCPICARVFRRWFSGEVLRSTKGREPIRMYTVLLEEAPQDKINDLDPTIVPDRLRKQLERAGLGKVPVIGGIEIVYKARKRVWVLHTNLVMIGGKKAARKKFKRGVKGSDIERPITWARLKKPAKQLSYVLKFSTYHRPYEQHGSKRSKAKPLNPKEHAALLKWMSQFGFQDFFVLVNAMRKGGTRVVLTMPAATKS
jgi:hypothetical protein